MNPNRKNRNAGRIAGMAIWVARIAAAALILVSSFALAWATSRSYGSKTDIDVKPPQLRSLHTKPPSSATRAACRSSSNQAERQVP